MGRQAPGAETDPPPRQVCLLWDPIAQVTPSGFVKIWNKWAASLNGHPGQRVETFSECEVTVSQDSIPTHPKDHILSAAPGLLGFRNLSFITRGAGTK